MTLLEAYSFLFADSLMTALLVPLQKDLVFPVMKIFGTYNLPIMVVLATLAATVGGAANWWLGRLILIATKYEPSEGRAMKFVQFWRNRGRLVLLLAWVPILGAVITVCLGVVGTRFRMVMAFVMAANFMYYLLLALQPV